MKNKKNYFISIIIIGHNTQKSLLALLSSLNNQNVVGSILMEVVYVDDGSTDGSIKAFKKFNLKFVKKIVCLEKNSGRVFATQAGINIAKGEWFYFVRSNVVLKKDVLSGFLKSINKFQNTIAFMGCIQYCSEDLAFHNYLNSLKRGIGRYKHNEKIHYKYLLFGNSIIHSRAFKIFQLNQQMRHYGGEELDLAEKIYLYYQEAIRACKRACVVRVGHPGFDEHCNRIEVFGQYNFQYLSLKNQKLILGFGFYFKKLKFLSFVWLALTWFSRKLYCVSFPALQYWIIRSGLFCSLMRGILKSKPSQNSQTPSLLM